MNTVKLLARLVAGSGPAMSVTAAQAVVNDLRQGAKRAPRIVKKISGLSADGVRVKIVDRAGWAQGSVASIQQMLQGVDAAVDFKDYQLGGAMSVLAAKVLGQWDPYVVNPRVYLVAPNVAQFQRQYDLDRRDVALWVAVHELTHAAQFAAAPWLAPYIAERAAFVLEIDNAIPPEPVLDELTAVMSLLEGHATFVMDRVPLAIMPSRSRLVRAMAARRAAGGFIAKKLSQALGMAKKSQQYVQGSDFATAVVGKVGIEGLNKAWEGEENLPTLHELTHPAEWIDRVVK